MEREQNLSRAEFADVSVYGKQPRGIVIRHPQADGTVKEEVRTRLKGEKWVKKTGAVVFIPLVSSQAHKSLRPNKAEMKRRRLRNKGNLRYAECPLAVGTAQPEHFKGQLRNPCQHGAASESKCCPHVQQLIDERKDRNHARRQRRIEAQRTSQTRTTDALTAIAEQLLRERASSPATPPATTRGASKEPSQ